MQLRLFRIALPSTKLSKTGKNIDLEEEIQRELLRQAYHSYNLAFVVTTCSALMSLAGVGLVYLDKIPAASVTTAGGVAASIGCIQFARQSKEELHQMINQMK